MIHDIVVSRSFDDGQTIDIVRGINDLTMTLAIALLNPFLHTYAIPTPLTKNVVTLLPKAEFY